MIVTVNDLPCGGIQYSIEFSAEEKEAMKLDKCTCWNGLQMAAAIKANLNSIANCIPVSTEN